MAESQEQPQQPQPPAVEFKRNEDFEALYANNVQAEISVWDLKVIFGMLDQSVVPNRVLQHTSVTVPWAQAKLFLYYLEVALYLHELQNGKVLIPPAIRPPDPSTVINVPGVSAEAREHVSQIYKDFISKL